MPLVLGHELRIPHAVPIPHPPRHRVKDADSVRLDKWLWAVRLFKTRTAAADGCRLGRVLSAGQPVKPSREVKVGDRFEVKQEWLTKTVAVKALLHQRVAAKLVSEYLDDLTPPEELEKARQQREEHRLATPSFAPGLGRPTKQQRRELERFQAAAELENRGLSDDEP